MQYEAASSGEITGRVDDRCPSLFTGPLFTGPLLFSKRHASVGDHKPRHVFLCNFIMEMVLLCRMVPSGVCRLAEVTALLLIVSQRRTLRFLSVSLKHWQRVLQ